MTATLDLTGKVAVVTGAASELGRASVASLVTAGATVAAVDAGADDDDVGAAVSIVADVSRPDDARDVAERVVAEFGGVDILVTHADRTRSTPLDAPRAQALADFDELFATNTAGPFLVQRAVVGSMIERGGGDIVNITTADVLPPRGDKADSPLMDIANASKWAINGFTQAWALGLRSHGVRVNAFAIASDAPVGHPGLLIDLLAEGPDGRTGETIGVRSGDPLALPPRRARGEEIV